jgi:5'-3' exonuclease
MGQKSDLSPECQKFVKKLFAFFSKEKAMKKPIVSFDAASAKTIRSITITFLVSTPNSK